MKIMAIRDNKAGAWHNPMYVNSVGGTLRSFGDEINSIEKGNPLAAHPEDYELWELGDWDEIKGKHTFLETPVSHGVGTNYRIAK